MVQRRRGKALSIMQVVLSLEAGGTERLVVGISNQLVSQGFEVHVCCLDGSGALTAALDRRIAVHELSRPTMFDPLFAMRLARLARRARVDVLHCHQYTPFVYGCFARFFAPGLGMVFTEHGRLAGATVSRRRRRVNRLLTQLGGEQFAVSAELRSFMLREGFSARRLSVLHNGITPGPLASIDDRQRARSEISVGEGDVVVGTTARLDPVKDLGSLVRAVRIAQHRLPRLRLAIIGDGPCRSELETTAQGVGLGGPLMLGYKHDVRSLLPAFDLYVNCSISEGISVAVLEAMDAGLAVVATAVGGTPEIIRDRLDGWLVPPMSPNLLADAIAALGSDPEARRVLGVSARKRVADAFSASAMISRYVSAYDCARG